MGWERRKNSWSACLKRGNYFLKNRNRVCMFGVCMVNLPPSAGALHQSLRSGIIVLSLSQSRTVITQGNHVDFQLPSWTIVRA